MKKVLGIVITLMLCLLPLTLKAVTADDEKISLSDFETKNFRDILKEEQIEEKFTNYTETDEQVTIYMLRGNGCGYCRAFLTFLNDITEEYGKYFKVVGFEVWYNEANADLMNKVSTFLGTNAGGVPYIIIGDQVFPGYASSYDDGIKTAITTLYESKDRYDVFEEYNEAVAKAKREKYMGFVTVGIINALVVVAGVAYTCYYVNKSKKELLAQLQGTKKVVKETETTEKPKAETTEKTKTIAKAKKKKK
jgi:glutaredoxin